MTVSAEHNQAPSIVPQTHRRRYKQTLSQPRHLWNNDAAVSQKLSKMVWVTVGKTEHVAWLVDNDTKSNGANRGNSKPDGFCKPSGAYSKSVLVQWETTQRREYVPAWNIRYNRPGTRTRRLRNS
uniref:Uncharacterized protein n=1 Tax=Craspedostauros australis TaxID=1486917 RepID=A0A7S0F6W1_9STRA|mmetsp:Transcript_9337/g.25377  ORF Transcript_9337/g.25377 Transcript_9337/m.25377 type:complete len:125 (+) Transcript_9337:299-673(+)